MARRIPRYKDPMKTKAGRRRIAERAVLDEKEEAEHGGLFPGIPKGPIRTFPELVEARERAAREAQRPRSLLDIVRDR